MAGRRIVYICDWLPPDYGAVGQYSALFARRLAEEGHDVVLGGLSLQDGSTVEETIGSGRLRTVKLQAPSYDKARFVQRMLWTLRINTRLIAGLWPYLRRADEILFTGSPPLLLHWIAPLNLIWRKHLVYRITDFHPECLMAAVERPPLALRLLYRLTLMWRRRVHRFEVLGEDQRARLTEIGIAAERISLKRDPSPVEIPPGCPPLPRPGRHKGKLLLLYSGNWGVAHDVDTFLAAYRQHHERGSGRFVLWLNAVGARADTVEAAIQAHGLPLIRTRPVPLDRLANLLVTPDAHLITLRDRFVGFVLPSKVYGCIASRRPVLYVGSARSDIHMLCTAEPRLHYERVDTSDVDGCLMAIERLADSVIMSQVGGLRRTAP